MQHRLRLVREVLVSATTRHVHCVYCRHSLIVDVYAIDPPHGWACAWGCRVPLDVEGTEDLGGMEAREVAWEREQRRMRGTT